MCKLFEAMKIREVVLRNRVVVSPMCMYSCVEGVPNDWHLVHLGGRAAGGAGLVMTEASAVSAEGRISSADAGIWNDEQLEAWRRVVRFIKGQGAVAGMQLAHAGRKASTDVPWRGGKPVGVGEGGWEVVGPSGVAFREGYQVPRELDREGMEKVVGDFVAGARRAAAAGFEVVEIHMAHGYLLHEFLSPLANRRGDEFGGSLENRMRFPLRVAEEVRGVWPGELPLFVRISATDWVEGGWDLAQSVELAKRLKKVGVDLVDCSSGGVVGNAKIPSGPGYQVGFAEVIRREAGVATGAVGLITEARQAEEIVAGGKADLVFLAREMLREPNWALGAARELGGDVQWPKQYERAKN